mmetsp:Transcript_8905/g.14130  ORF Transcript_8905/g.14130 Transcript_8905/m.14130 type:complete len:128 (-) Transcript_8905:220-603(-)
MKKLGNISELTYAVFDLQIASVLLQPYFGALGLMLANCCTMSIRIAYALCYVHMRFRGLGFLTAALPRINVVLSMLVMSACTWYTSTAGFVFHFAAGMLSLAGICLSLGTWERETVTHLRSLKNKIE